MRTASRQSQKIKCGPYNEDGLIRADSRSRLSIARMAHQRADAAQAVLSAVKILVALLPDHTTRELWPSGLSVDIMLRFRSPL
jgi:hypothetical protein